MTLTSENQEGPLGQPLHLQAEQSRAGQRMKDIDPEDFFEQVSLIAEDAVTHQGRSSL